MGSYACAAQDHLGANSFADLVHRRRCYNGLPQYPSIDATWERNYPVHGWCMLGNLVQLDFRITWRLCFQLDSGMLAC